MDVTCERCGTEYDFDETLVSERGTTVKCTNCGHLFKVYRKGSAASADATARPWLVRRENGPSEVIATLRDLQKRITEGALSPDDEISRSGEGWKKLGSIAELDTFFAASRAAGHQSGHPRNDSAFSLAPRTPFGQSPSNRPPSDPALASTVMDEVRNFQVPKAPRPPSLDTAKQTVMGIGPSSQPPPQSRSGAPRSVPPPLPPKGKGTLIGMAHPSSPPFPAPPRSVPPPSSDAQAALADETINDRPSRRTEQNAPSQAPRTPSVRPPSVRPPTRPILIEEEDRTEMQPRRKNSGTPWGMMLLFAVFLGGGIAVAWMKFNPRPQDNQAARSRILREGDARLAEDDDAGYNDAITVYARAQAFDANDVQALSSISRAHALWAQALIFEADDLEARGAGDLAQRAVAERVRSESRMHANEAKRYAEMAMRANSTDANARIAAADAARLTNDLARARSTFNLANGDSAEASAEALRVGALLAMDEGAHQVARAKALAERAVQKDPSSAAARLLLARAHLAEGNIAAARSAVDAVLAAHPQHARALALKDAMDRGLPPAAPVIAADPNAGDAAVAPTGAPEAVPVGRDYDFYITQGETLLEAHSERRARAYFDAALRVRPGDARAQNGLGFVALNEHEHELAAQRFEAASAAGSLEAMIGLGEAYRRLRRDEDALRVYQRYLQRGGPESAIARHWVETLTEALHGPGASPPPLDQAAPTPPAPAPEGPAPQEAPAPESAPLPSTAPSEGTP